MIDLTESQARFPERVAFTRTGLVLPADVTEQEWRRAGEALGALGDARDWAIGDWLNAGQDHGYVARNRYDLGLELFPDRSRKRPCRISPTRPEAWNLPDVGKI
jgi:hypothetical protein